MKNHELLAAITGLTEYQKSKVVELVCMYEELNAQLADTKPDRCPKCGKVHDGFWKRGFVGGKQRYQCKECGKRFVYDCGRLTSRSQQSPEKWRIAIEDTISLASLDKMAEHIGVCHTTAFYMRQKILICMEKAVKEMPELDGLIEADETYLLESQKGVKVTGRKPRKHGEGASKRGLSDEQICVCMATDRNNHVVAKSVNRAKASSEDIKAALEEKIAEKSVIQCDGADSYNALIQEKDCKKVELVGHESYDKIHHLNTVNGLHSKLKEMNRIYRGVSTKYLNRYLAMFAIREMLHEDTREEMMDRLLQKLRLVETSVVTADLQSINLLQV